MQRARELISTKESRKIKRRNQLPDADRLGGRLIANFSGLRRRCKPCSRSPSSAVHYVQLHLLPARRRPLPCSGSSRAAISRRLVGAQNLGRSRKEFRAFRRGRSALFRRSILSRLSTARFDILLHSISGNAWMINCRVS